MDDLVSVRVAETGLVYTISADLLRGIKCSAAWLVRKVRVSVYNDEEARPEGLFFV